MPMRWRTGLTLPLLTALLVAALPEERAVGQAPRDVKLDGPAIDGMVSTTLREVILRGAPIYNAGDFDSCYHLYEGALMAVKPLLGHRVGLQREIDRALVNAERSNDTQKRAWILREAMDTVRSEIRGKAEGPVPVLGSVKASVTVDGQPLPAGKVILWGDKDHIHTGVVTAGMFSIDKIPLGKYVIYVDVPDALRATIDPRYLLPTTSPLGLEIADTKTLTGELKLTGPTKTEVGKTPGGVLGKVTVDGKPFTGAAVVLFPAGGGLKTGVVKEDGTYTIEKLPPGPAKVVINPPTSGGPKIEEKYQDKATTPLAVEVLADKGTVFDIALKSAGAPKNPEEKEPVKDRPNEKKELSSVFGVVTLRDKPLMKGTVILVNEARETISGPIGEDGAYRFDKVPAGKYKVVIQSPDAEGKEVLPERYSNQAKAILTVEVAPPTTRLDLKLLN
jgi:hypothetical protein